MLERQFIDPVENLRGESLGLLDDDEVAAVFDVDQP